MRNANILLVDFHKMIRDGLKAMLTQQKGFKVESHISDEEQLFEKCQLHEIDLIIFNADSGELDKIELVKDLKKRNPDIKILALATVQNDQHIRQLFQAGSSGYMLKDSDSEELFKAINTILDGSLYFSEEITQAVMQRFIKTEDKKQRKGNPFSLTDREVEVLGFIVREFTNQEIAEKLSISVRTVESHRRNLLQKTGSRNTAGLVRYALENEII